MASCSTGDCEHSQKAADLRQSQAEAEAAEAALCAYVGEESKKADEVEEKLGQFLGQYAAAKAGACVTRSVPRMCRPCRLHS